MKREEFIQFYADNSGVTVEEILAVRTPVPCDCGAGMCVGWIMLPSWLADSYAPDTECMACGNQAHQIRKEGNVATYECPVCSTEVRVIIISEEE